MNLPEILGIAHLAFSVFIGIYGFVIPKSFGLDFVYILWHFVVNIHWTFLNGECIMTYLYKKGENKDYIAGQDSTDMKDMSMVLNRNVVQTIVAFGVVFTGISLYIVFKRNFSLVGSNALLFGIIGTFYAYTLYLRVKAMYFWLYQEMYKCFLIITFFYILSRYAK
jgi:hypothetical protein